LSSKIGGCTRLVKRQRAFKNDGSEPRGETFKEELKTDEVEEGANTWKKKFSSSCVDSDNVKTRMRYYITSLQTREHKGKGLARKKLCRRKRGREADLERWEICF